MGSTALSVAVVDVMAAVMVDTADAVVELECWLLAWGVVVCSGGCAEGAMGVTDAVVGALDVAVGMLDDHEGGSAADNGVDVADVGADDAVVGGVGIAVGEIDAAEGDVDVVDVVGCGAVVAGIEYLWRGPLDTAVAVAAS